MVKKMNAKTMLIVASIVALAGVSAMPSVAADPNKSYVQCTAEFVLSQIDPAGCDSSDDISPLGTEFTECHEQIGVSNDELIRQCVIA